MFNSWLFVDSSSISQSNRSEVAHRLKVLEQLLKVDPFYAAVSHAVRIGAVQSSMAQAASAVHVISGIARKVSHSFALPSWYDDLDNPKLQSS